MPIWWNLTYVQHFDSTGEKRKCFIFSFHHRQTPASEWLTHNFYQSQPFWLGSSSPSYGCAIWALCPIRSLPQTCPGKGSLAIYYLPPPHFSFARRHVWGCDMSRSTWIFGEHQCSLPLSQQWAPVSNLRKSGTHCSPRHSRNKLCLSSCMSVPKLVHAVLLQHWEEDGSILGDDPVWLWVSHLERD